MVKVCIELESNESMIIELYPEVAPLTVANFLKLVDKKYYDGLIFHRVIKDFMAQAGGYTFNENKKEIGLADEVKSIKGEFSSNGVNNKLSHDLGVISMARTNVKDSASSQFFICTASSLHLNGQYAAFGKVCDGFDVLEKLNNCQTVNVGGGLTDFPYPVIRIKTIKRI